MADQDNAMIEESFFEPEEPLFEDGPSRGAIELWKKKYGQVFLTEVENDGVFIWRVLTRRELRELVKVESEDALYKEDMICRQCVIWPEGYDPDLGKAGTATVLSEQIFEKSGFRASNSPIPL